MDPVPDNIYYFDSNSTSLIHDQTVLDEIMQWVSCGNPSNILHSLGRAAHDKIEECRGWIAEHLGVTPEEIYFTSGATESNNQIIQGVVRYYLEKEGGEYTVITSAFEHPSVLNIFKHFENLDRINVVYVSPYCQNGQDTNQFSADMGRIRPEDIEEAIQNAKGKVILISVMHANNETGAVQDIERIGEISEKYGIFFHTDATQTMGKFRIRPQKLRINAISFSGHKFNGPKGIGGMYICKSCDKVMNLCYGGEQEGSGRRPGTENVAYIAGMTRALQIAHTKREVKNERIRKMKDWIIRKLNEPLRIRVLGCTAHTLPNTILVLIQDIRTCNKKIVENLDKERIYVSVGSACQSKKKHSHVLDYLQVEPEDRIKVIRISLDDYTTPQQCGHLVKILVREVLTEPDPKVSDTKVSDTKVLDPSDPTDPIVSSFQ